MDSEIWTKTEKHIAREAFDKAYRREYESIRKEVIRMVNEKTDLNEIWSVGNFLSKQRKMLDWKYDYRYSKLIGVFGILLSQGWVTMEDLKELSSEKLESIQLIARNFSDE